MNKTCRSFFFLLITFTTPLVAANDFPSLERVEYVMQCMERNGGQNYQNLYRCVCILDNVAKKMSFESYAQAKTFAYLKGTPGERGGLFRDPPQSSQLRNSLKEAESAAKAACTVKKP